MKKTQRTLASMQPIKGALRCTVAMLAGLLFFEAPSALASPLSVRAAHRTVVADRQVTGTIQDEKGQPMPGVTVVVKGTSLGTISGTDGGYSITVPTAQEQNLTLVYSFVGYESQELVVSDRLRIDVAMTVSASLLEQVVVVGYSSKKLKYLTSSVSSISNEKLRDVTANDLPSLLQGKAAGVVVSTSSGDPTSSPRILIRGAGTISAGTAPLTVVDGNMGYL